MDLNLLLKNYLQKIANSPVPMVQNQAKSLQDSILQSQEDEDVVDADVEKKQPTVGNQEKPLDVEDTILQNAMPEMQMPDSDDSTFGKVSCFKALQKKSSVKKNITIFTALQAKYGNHNNSRKVAFKK